MSRPVNQVVRTLPPNVDRPTWIEIDRKRLWGNVAALRERIGEATTLIGVVKANAYGHDAALVAPEIIAAGVDRLAVAAVNEGDRLRRNGVEAPIHILGYTPSELTPLLLADRLIPTVYDWGNLLDLDGAARQAGERLNVHVKVDTGMHRLGLSPAETPDFLRQTRTLSSIHVEGLFTHFASADEVDDSPTDVQMEQMNLLLAHLTAEGLRPSLVHAANSAALLRRDGTHFDGVRAGIALYGLQPGPGAPLGSEFQPILSWKCRIAQVRDIAIGEGVSYGAEWRADRPSQIAVIPVGYADGFPRGPRSWHSVLIRGQRAPVIGRVCMDQAMVDVTDISARHGSPEIGEEVVLIGRQGAEEISVDEVAESTGTINYEVVSRILDRVPRIGIGDIVNEA